MHGPFCLEKLLGNEENVKIVSWRLLKNVLLLEKPVVQFKHILQL